MELEQRLGLIEKAILTMKDLVVSHSERFDSHDERLGDYYSALKESREDFEFKMNALVDAQIRNEAEIEKLWSVNKTHEARLQKLENS